MLWSNLKPTTLVTGTCTALQNFITKKGCLVLKVGENSDMAPVPGHMTDCSDPYRIGEGFLSTGNSGLNVQHTVKQELFGGK